MTETYIASPSLPKECSICLSPFDIWMRLPRRIHDTSDGRKHVACTECINKHWQKDLSVLVCPYCQEEVEITSPDHLGIETSRFDYQTSDRSNFCHFDDDPAKSRCDTCRIYLCHDCSKSHRKGRVTRSHDVKDIEELSVEEKANFSQRTMCSKPDHGFFIELYCKTCKFPCCDRCAIEEHKTHELEQLKNILEGKSDLVNRPEIGGQKKRADALRKHYQKMLEAVQNRQSSSEQCINELFTKAVKMLEDRKELLLSQLSEKNQKLQLWLDSKIRNLDSKSQTLRLAEAAAAGMNTATTDIGLLAFYADLERTLKSLQKIDVDRLIKDDEERECGYDFLPGQNTDIIQQFLLGMIQTKGIEEDVKESGQPEIRILVIGKKATGRGKTIYCFMDQLKPMTDNQRGAKVWNIKFSGKPFKIVITAGLDNPSVKGGIKREKDDIATLLSPGPHIVLLIVKNAELEEQVNILSDYKSIFNEDISRHLILIYTGKKEMNGVPMDEYAKGRGKGHFRSLLHQTGRRCITFNPYAKEEHQTFRYELCKLINVATEMNENMPLALGESSESVTSDVH